MAGEFTSDDILLPVKEGVFIKETDVCNGLTSEENAGTPQNAELCRSIKRIVVVEVSLPDPVFFKQPLTDKRVDKYEIKESRQISRADPLYLAVC